jgi:3-hydroxybutyryl-CoA dehydratase
MLQLAQMVEVQRCFSVDDIADYVALGGHVPPDDEVPEPLVGAMFSYLLGVKLPGPGTNYLKQDSEFNAPARVGETLTARVEVARLRPDKHLVDLNTTCRNSKGDLIVTGRALVYVRDVRR